MHIHLILIHGAWQGSWVWQPSLPYFEQKGLFTYPVDLPGSGSPGNQIEDIGIENIQIDSYVKTISDVISRIEQGKSFNPRQDKVVLVAHSGGGVVATQVAENYASRIDAVIYLAGMMLPPLVSFKNLLEQLKQQGFDYSGIETCLKWNADGSVSEVLTEAGAKIFLNDLPYNQAIKSAAKLTAQATSGLAIEANWSQEKFGQIPRLYVECMLDRSVKPGIQKIMQRLVPGAKKVSLNTGHAPHVSQPELTVNVISAFLFQLFVEQ